MLLPSVFAVLSTLTAVLAVWETGAPCQAQFTLKPLGSNSGVTTLDPPYQFSIRNTRGESVKSYAPKTIYT
uniref:Uncharacterized protein n=1 Tax=Plectus sambesii TaxID=2011161 RepID=A0A914VRX2_9BILA